MIFGEIHGKNREHTQILQQFLASNFCRYLSPGVKKILLDTSRVESTNKGQLLYRQEEELAHFYFICEGWVKIYHLTSEGDQAIHHFAGPTETFGCFGVCGCHSTSQQNAESLTKSVFLVWDNQVIKQLLQEDNQLSFHLLFEAVKKIKELEMRNVELSTHHVEQRVVLGIERLLERLPLPFPVTLPFPLSCQELADYMGCSLYTISRLLSAWEQQGLIERGRQWLTIKDLDKLKSTCLTRS